MCVHDVGAGTTVHTWRSEANSEELVFPIHLYISSRDQTQIDKLVQQAPLPNEP